MRRKILFIGEGVTLAHVTRMVTLASFLPVSEYEVILAADPRCQWVFNTTQFPVHTIASIEEKVFTGRLAAGKPAYDRSTLSRYVSDDIKLLNEVRPDVVVGDFRLSLSVSARKLGIPYVNITNAYWSPDARIERPGADVPQLSLFGKKLGRAIFAAFIPLISRAHAAPMNLVCREHGRKEAGRTVLDVYTDGDLTLFADLPELIPIDNLPSNRRFIGPVVWSPSLPLPAWWNDLSSDMPVVYLTLGSSGATELLPSLVQALSALPIQLMIATAGRVTLNHVPPHCFVAPYLPGELAAQRAALVISNGGTPTSYQALKHGVPILGICSNYDQLLFMRAIEKAGAGRMVRAADCTPSILVETVSETLKNEQVTCVARELQGRIQSWDSPAVFSAALSSL